MADHDADKLAAAELAAAEVQEGMLVGLGTGSTAAHAIRAIGARVAAGLRIEATATSLASEQLARSLNIPVRPFEELAHIDLAIDGADEIDAQLQAIKGGGGALLREKIVAAAAARTIIIVDSSKRVALLGATRALPLEVLPFAAAFVEGQLVQAGYGVTRRRAADGSPAHTDQQNYLFDVAVGEINDPPQLAAWLAALPGLIEHGLFLTEIDELFLAEDGKVQVIKKPIS